MIGTYCGVSSLISESGSRQQWVPTMVPAGGSTQTSRCANSYTQRALGQSGRRDLNPGPLAPEASALPSCATPRIGCFSYRANNLARWPESTKWSRYHRADEKRGRPRGMSRHYSRDFPSAFWARDQCHSGAFLARSTRAGPCTAAKLPLFRRAIRTLPSYKCAQEESNPQPPDP